MNVNNITPRQVDVNSFEFALAFEMRRRGKQVTPYQLDIARWIDRNQHSKWKILLAMRGLGKSTISTIYVAWKLNWNLDRSFLIVSENKSVARRNLINIRERLENSPVFANAQKRLGQTSNRPWTSDEMWIPGSHSDDPNVQMRSVDSGITGTHADEGIGDDVETRENVRSELRLAKIQNEIWPEFGIVVNDQRFLIGTFWLFDSEYRYRMEQLKATGQGDCIKRIAWYPGMDPVRFPDEEILELKKRNPALYKGQYELEPTDIGAGHLDPNYFVDYDEEVEITPTSNGLNMKIMGNVIKSVSAGYDPSYGKLDDKGRPAGSRSVLSIIYRDYRNNVYWREAKALPPHNTDNGFDTQYHDIVTACQQHKVDTVHVETTQYNTNFTGLQNYAASQEVPLAAIPVKPLGNKWDTIDETIGPILFSGQLYIHKEAKHDWVVKEFMDFPQKNKPNDALDSLKIAIHATGDPVIDLSEPSYDRSILDPVKDSIIWQTHDEEQEEFGHW